PAGGHHPQRVRPLRLLLHEGAAEAGLPVGGAVHHGRGLLHLPRRPGRVGLTGVRTSAAATPSAAEPGWFVFILMASVTFVGLLSELIPSGILPQMSEGLGVSESRIGVLVGVYALASAVCTIPLIRATLPVNRKHLLLTLLAGFAVSNLVVGLSSSYAVMVGARIAGGVCAGVMWPMIAAYGTRLVPPGLHGRVITVIMAGSTLGISIGLPAMTMVGLKFGWRTEFVVFGLGVAVLAVLCHLHLPAVPGERRTRSN